MPSTAPPRKRVSYEAFQAKAPAAATTTATATTEADKVKEEEEEMEMACRRCHPSMFGRANTEFSAVLRDFSEGIIRLERRDMEVQWEIKRGWKETEVRQTRMLNASCASPLLFHALCSRRRPGGTMVATEMTFRLQWIVAAVEFW
jgi:hypothetical protein